MTTLVKNINSIAYSVSVGTIDSGDGILEATQHQLARLPFHTILWAHRFRSDVGIAAMTGVRCQNTKPAVSPTDLTMYRAGSKPSTK